MYHNDYSLLYTPQLLINEYKFLQVFQVAYCLPVYPDNLSEARSVIQHFVDTRTVCMQEYSKRSKVHLLLHLIDDIVQFGPTCCYSTER